MADDVQLGRTDADSVPMIEPLFDRAAVLSDLATYLDLLGEMIGIYRTHVPALAQTLRAAIAADQANTAARTAHQLSGAVSHFYAAPLRATARRIEMLARESKLSAAAALLDGLDDQIEQLGVALEQFNREIRCTS